MKRIRRLLLVFTLIIIGGCLVLLLNITASNPTRRRYSSRPVLISGNGSEIGSDAENALVDDLGIPHNGSTNQRQCICNTGALGVPSGCTLCLVSVPLSASYRIPDFVANNFIVEAKNRQTLLASQSDQLGQIRDYAAAASALKRPLWLFIRVETEVDPAYQQLVEATGGQIVPYFAPPDYSDPVDTSARKGLIGAAALGAVIGYVEVSALRRRVRLGSTPTVTIPVNPNKPTHPVTQAMQSVDHAEKFLRSTKDDVNDQLGKYE